ncbi:MAG: TAXI family TRAP transporter solute-binding subunit [Acetobacterales bacterium]
MLRRSFMISALAASAVLASGHAHADRSKWPQSLTLGTASVGGTYYIYGGGWANMVAEQIKVPINTQQTQGPVQNVILVETQKIELGMTTMGVALGAWNGTAQWTQGKQFRAIRAMFPMYDTPFHGLALKKSGIKSFKDLNDKTVGVGPKAGTPGTYYPLIFDALGIKATIRNGGASDMAGQLGDGLLDAFVFAGGVPIAAFSELEAKQDVQWLHFTSEEIASLKKKIPELSDSAIGKSVYTQLEKDYETLGLYNFAIAHESMPEDLVYEITKSVMDNHDRMMQIHAASAETIPGNVTKNTFLPFHPGAVRYFKEKGIAIPANLM